MLRAPTILQLKGHSRQENIAEAGKEVLRLYASLCLELLQRHQA